MENVMILGWHNNEGQTTKKRIKWLTDFNLDGFECKLHEYEDLEKTLQFTYDPNGAKDFSDYDGIRIFQEYYQRGFHFQFQLAPGLVEGVRKYYQDHGEAITVEMLENWENQDWWNRRREDTRIKKELGLL